MIAECPEKETLLNYLSGQIPSPAAQEMEAHFTACNLCEETIRNLDPDDTFSQIVLSAIEPPAESELDSQFSEDPSEQPYVENLIRRIQRSFSPLYDDVALREHAGEVNRLLEPSDLPDALGELNGYVIYELLGAGSTGVVFRAVDASLDRTVALKILRPSLGEAAKKRFMAEARLAASIEHPHVVSIYQVGEIGSLAFIAMQWAAGETLEERLRKVSFLPEDQSRKLVGQIASGLAAAHDCNLIHRDIKPANIWLKEDGDDVLILDFGLARIADDDPHLTQTGMLAGTPNFMSPEQSRGLELDGRSDLFSLGSLLYQSLTGKLPFGASGILATLQAIQNETPRAPHELNPHLSEDMSDLTMTLLEKQPANRPDSARTLEQALDSDRDQWPFVATRQPNSKPAKDLSPQKVFGSSNRGNRSFWVSTAIGLLLLITGAFFFGPQVIRIATNKGELVIETNDKNVEIQVLSGGDVVHVIDTKSKQRIDIKAGTYQFKVVDSSNEFQVTPQSVVMSRGGKKIVSIRMIENKTGAGVTRSKGNSSGQRITGAVGSSGPIRGTSSNSQNIAPGSSVITGSVNSVAPLGNAVANPGEATYDGRTFNNWLRLVKTERKATMISNGLKALGELADQPARKTAAIEAVRTLTRKYGSRIITGSDDDLTEPLNRFFAYLSPDDTVQFAIDEIKDGNRQSRQQVSWLLVSGSVYQASQDQIQAHRDTIRNRILEILSPLVSVMEQVDIAQKRDLFFLMRNALTTAYGSRANDPFGGGGFGGGGFGGGGMGSGSQGGGLFLQIAPLNAKIELEKKVTDWIRHKMNSSPDKITAMCLASQLISFGKADKETFKTFFDALGQSDVKGELPGTIFTQTIGATPRENLADAIPGIIKLLDDPKSLKRLTWGFYSPAKTAIDLFTRNGADAAAALPWLKKQVAQKTDLAVPAESAIKQIEKEIAKQKTYAGRTFDQWATILPDEKNPKTIGDGIVALGALLDPSNNQQTHQAFKTIDNLMVKHGSYWIDNEDGNYVEEFNKFFGYLTPQMTIDFFRSRFNVDQINMQKQLFWLLVPESIYSSEIESKDTMQSRDLYREKLKEAAEFFVPMMTQALRSEDKEVDWIVGKSLNQIFASTLRYGTYDEEGKYVQERLMMPDAHVKMLWAICQKQTNGISTKDQANLASCLIRYAKPDAEMKKYVEIFVNANKGRKIEDIERFDLVETWQEVPSEYVTKELLSQVTAHLADDDYWKNYPANFRTSEKSKVTKTLASWGKSSGPALEKLRQLAADAATDEEKALLNSAIESIEKNAQK